MPPPAIGGGGIIFSGGPAGRQSVSCPSIR